MKYLINLLFLLGAAFFLGGCSDDDDPVDTPRLEVSESSLRFGSLATEQVIQVTSSEAWKIANIPDWLSVEPVSGQAGEYEVKVAVIENTTEVERKAWWFRQEQKTGICRYISWKKEYWRSTKKSSSLCITILP